MGYPVIIPAPNKLLAVKHADISAAGSEFFKPGFRGRVKKIHITLHGAITSAPAVHTTEINGVAITGASISVTHTASAAGTSFSLDVPDTPTAYFDQDSVIESISDGASSTTAAATVVYELEPK